MKIRCGAFCLILGGMVCTLLLSNVRSTWAHAIACAECHRYSYPIAAMREALCLVCHGPGGSSTLRAVSHASLDCYDCHEPHDGERNWLSGKNIMQLRGEVDKTGQHSNSLHQRQLDVLPVIETPAENRVPVVFESRGPAFGEPTLHSFADGDEDGNGIYDGICEACHWSYLTATGHYRGKTCTKCHPHNCGFRVK